MIRILFISTGLEVGGAEMMLLKLLTAIDRDHFHAEVIALTGPATLGDQIRDLGFAVHPMGMSSSLSSLRTLRSVRQIARAYQPHVLQGWMYHGNLAASALGWCLFGRSSVGWSIRTTANELSSQKPRTQKVIRASAHLSAQPGMIIYNAHASVDSHDQLGFSRKNARVIPNGFDLTRFKPDPIARALVRRELELPAHTPVVGHVGRFHPVKDHAGFLAAAALLHRRQPDVHFVLVGKEVTRDNPVLWREVVRHKLEPFVHLLGPRTDVPQVMAAFDLATCNSAWGEAFPNVVGEAMACGLPCVVTDLGDGPRILGGTGRVVPVRAPEALAEAWQALLTLSPSDRQRMGQAARGRIEAEYTLEHVIQQYAEAFRALAR